jgi:soluble lytic murein transglycosylase-like protein
LWKSRYDPALSVASVKIGVMQVRPETAKMLGFRGSLA